MHKKKELFIIIFVVLITIMLSVIPLLINRSEGDVEKEKKDNYITITINGEVNYSANEFDSSAITNTFSLKVPSGITFGELSKAIDIYYTKYSVKPKNYQTRYFTDTIITIASSYKEEVTEDSNPTDEGLVNINTASKAELKTLYGIGEARAESIISYRSNKLIETYKELKEIIGVSDEVMEIIKNSSVL